MYLVVIKYKLINRSKNMNVISIEDKLSASFCYKYENCCSVTIKLFLKYVSMTVIQTK